MTTYTTDFTDVANPFDIEAHSWTRRWHAATGSTSTYFFVRTEQDLSKLLIGYRTTVERYTLSWDDIDSDANRQDSEVLAKWRVTTTGGFQAWSMIRGSGTTTTETAYIASIDSSGGNIDVRKYDAGTASSVSSTTKTISTDTWYWSRFRVNGTTLRLRVWADSVSEPGTWDIDTTDSAISGDGWVGVGYYDDATEWEWISVGTNGDTAPDPDTGGTARIAGLRGEILFETGSEAEPQQVVVATITQGFS